MSFFTDLINFSFSILLRSNSFSSSHYFTPVIHNCASWNEMFWIFWCSQEGQITLTEMLSYRQGSSQNHTTQERLLHGVTTNLLYYDAVKLTIKFLFTLSFMGDQFHLKCVDVNMFSNDFCCCDFWKLLRPIFLETSSFVLLSISWFLFQCHTSIPTESSCITDRFAFAIFPCHAFTFPFSFLFFSLLLLGFFFLGGGVVAFN